MFARFFRHHRIRMCFLHSQEPRIRPCGDMGRQSRCESVLVGNLFVMPSSRMGFCEHQYPFFPIVERDCLSGGCFLFSRVEFVSFLEILRSFNPSFRLVFGSAIQSMPFERLAPIREILLWTFLLELCRALGWRRLFQGS